MPESGGVVRLPGPDGGGSGCFDTGGGCGCDDCREREREREKEREERRKRERRKQEEEVDKCEQHGTYILLFLTLGLTTVFALVVFSGGPKNAGAWIGGFFVSLLISICALPYILALAGYRWELSKKFRESTSSSSGGGGGAGCGAAACGGGGGGCGGG